MTEYRKLCPADQLEYRLDRDRFKAQQCAVDNYCRREREEYERVSNKTRGMGCNE